MTRKPEQQESNGPKEAGPRTIVVPAEENRRLLQKEETTRDGEEISESHSGQVQVKICNQKLQKKKRQYRQG